jgi:hypothetical protein
MHPVFLFHPQYFFLQHAVTLGNKKPKKLQETENAMWAMMLNMAAGVNQEEQMTNFFNKLDMIENLEDAPLEADWFVNSE